VPVVGAATLLQAYKIKDSLSPSEYINQNKFISETV